MLMDHENLRSLMDRARRVSAPDRSAGPRSSFDIISGSIIARARQMELLMLCLDSYRGATKKEKFPEPKTLESYTAYNPHSPMPGFLTFFSFISDTLHQVLICGTHVLPQPRQF